jgi:hypothetical protein
MGMTNLDALVMIYKNWSNTFGKLFITYDSFALGVIGDFLNVG